MPIPILLVAATISVRSRGFMLESLSIDEVCDDSVAECDIALKGELSYC